MENNEKIICMCNEISEKEIIKAIKEKNCNTVEKVGDETGAGTICGGCIPLIEELIEKFKKE
ncbi:MAG: (2Fe-2S)-binding protein [Bacteroidales bacterium]|jgi:NAD(P)H-nitrite reductase large subunit|nr:(2Fe-2S)-binding protein [Bacteroidales bacterium]HOL98325.1 (2Fe-2S)-binding protein [Bacteroidales bacterium]HOM35737.1 (2Fe-2S)-binding protein [Bacteroidales bacterium]HPD23123.1 (2Fe-2S)-binding protein [Bacteroidales bacterium]HRS99052.1 (2Fe-2S)-binding protein [Bacteroidales bacterium]